jgi:hypothetical protein
MAVRIGKDGKMETVPDPSPIDLEKLRRETRDRIAGNERFHVDPNAAPAPPAPAPAPAPWHVCATGTWRAGACASCSICFPEGE